LAPSRQADDHAPPLPASGTAAKSGPPRLDVNDLFGGAREAVLVHRGTEYRLRITSNDKLILTK